MKFLILTLFFIFYSALSFSQKQLDVTWGDEMMFRKNVEYNEVIGIVDDKLYVISSSGEKPENSINVNLEIYNAESLTYDKGINIVENKSDENFEKILIVENRIIVFTSHYDRELNMKILNLREYDIQNNEMGEVYRIDEVSTFDKSDIKSFVINASPDGNYILIYHDNPSVSGNKVFNLKVINSEFLSHWEKEFTLNYKDKMVNYSEILIDDNSNVYLLSTINPFGINKASGLGALVNVKSTLFSYRPQQDKMKEFEFALSRNWIDEVSMVFDENQNVLATAFFTYPNDYKIRGFVLFEMDSWTGEVVGKKMVTLDKSEFKTVDKSIGRLKEYSRMLVGSTSIYPGSSSHMNSTSTEFLMKDIVVNDHSIILAIEAFRRDERCSESFSDQQMIVDCQKNYLYGDVVLFFLNRKFEITNITQVKKMQHAINKLNSYYSFGIMDGGEEVYVFYNDDYRNFDPETQGSLKKPLTNLNKSRLNIEAFSGKGEKIKFDYVINDNDRIPYFPLTNFSISESQYLLYSQKEKNYKFGKLSVR